MTWESAEPADRWKREPLAREGLAALDRFRERVKEYERASGAADAVIRAVGGRPPPSPVNGRKLPEEERTKWEKRLEIAELLHDRVRKLRSRFRAEVRGLPIAERAELPPEVPDEVARSFPPLRSLKRDVEEARWIASLVSRSIR